jgi:hypothetical protein
MTQFYHVTPSFFDHCVRVDAEPFDFGINRVAPIKFLPQTHTPSYPGFLVTGDKEYLKHELHLIEADWMKKATGVM